MTATDVLFLMPHGSGAGIATRPNGISVAAHESEPRCARAYRCAQCDPTFSHVLARVPSLLHKNCATTNTLVDRSVSMLHFMHASMAERSSMCCYTCGIPSGARCGQESRTGCTRCGRGLVQPSPNNPKQRVLGSMHMCM